MAQINDSWRAGGKGYGPYTLQARAITETPLIAKGYSGQTANIFEVQNSAGTTLFAVDPTGDLIISGSISLTIDEAITGDLTVSGNTTLGNAAADTLTVNATSSFVSPVAISGTLTVTGESTFGSITGSDRFLGNLAVDNGLTVSGQLVVGGTSSFAGVATFLDGAFFPDNENLRFGNSAVNPDATINWETADASAHYLNIALGTSRNIIISEDRNIDWTHAASTNPTLWIQSSDSGTVADYIALSHDQTDANIVVGAGDLLLNIQGANLAPSANDGAALGISGKAFSDLYLASGGIIDFNAGDIVLTHSANILTMTGGNFVITQPIIDAATPTAFTTTGGAHTGITAATECIGMNLNFSANKTWAVGAGPLALQREIAIQAPTYIGDVAGALTITVAATVDINGAPTAGANMTITDSYSLRTQAGNVVFNDGSNDADFRVESNNMEYAFHVDGANDNINFNTSGFAGFFISALEPVRTSGVPTTLLVQGAAHTGITAATEAVGIDLDMDASKTWAAGAGPLATQREVLVRAPTYIGNAAGALTITTAATLAIVNAPTAGADMTITNAHALWVQAGNAQFDGGATLASVTISGANPTLTFKDTDCTVGDPNFTIDAQATDTGNGSEDIDVTFMQQVAGANSNFLVTDADGGMTLNPGTTFLEITLKASQNFILDEGGTDFWTINRTNSVLETDATTGTGTLAGIVFDVEDITTGDGLYINGTANNLTSGSLVKIESDTTAANAYNLLELVSSGANANATRTRYGLNISMTGTGATSTNIGTYYNVSGATTNYSINVAAGNARFDDAVIAYFGSDSDWGLSYDEATSDALILYEGTTGSLAFKGSSFSWAAANDTSGNNLFVQTQDGGVDVSLAGGNTGANFRIGAGAGSNAGGGSAGDGGDGGTYNNVAGAGGNGDGAGAGGGGGAIQFVTGDGGDAGDASFMAGQGGDINLTMGVGGDSTADLSTAGIGGGMSWTLGSGGDGSGANAVGGGLGGSFSIASGQGGDGINAGSGGFAGSMTFSAGAGGSGGATGTAGGGGSVTVSAGSAGFAGNAPGTAGGVSIYSGGNSILGGVAGATGTVDIYTAMGAFALAGDNNGGATGAFNIYTSTAGDANGAGTGGNSGNFSIYTGVGGGTATGTGGNGGTLSITGGNGGASTGVAGTGGIGSSITITAGTGGADSEGSAGTGGDGGDITFTPGAGGAGNAAGSDGVLIFKGSNTNDVLTISDDLATFASNITATLGATEKLFIDGSVTRTGTTELLDIDATIDTTVATDDVTVATILASRAATDTGGTRGWDVTITTGDMANAEFSYCYGGTYNTSAAATATSNAAVFYAGASTVDAQCNDYGIYISTGYDTAGAFGGAITPVTSDGGALGTSTVMWSDLFLASGGIINFDNGDVTLTHAANSLAFAGATSGYSFDNTVSISTTVISMNIWNTSDTASNQLMTIGGANRAVPADNDEFYLSCLHETSTTLNTETARLTSFLSDATHASYAGGLQVEVWQAATQTEYLRLYGDSTGTDTGFVVWNEGGGDIDHRWESDSSIRALEVDGRTGDVKWSRATFYDEFWNGVRPEWATRNTTGSVAAQSVDNGVYRLTTGAVDDQEESIDWNDVCTFSNTERPSFHVRLQLDLANNVQVRVGLTESAGVGVDDFICFRVNSDTDTNWYLVASDGGAETTDVGPAANTNMVDFKWEFTSDTALEWFYSTDGGETWASQGTVAANVPTEQLQPFVEVIVRNNGGARYINLDMIKIGQDRI